MKSPISDFFAQSLQLQKLEQAIAQNASKTYIQGVTGSAFSFTVAELFKKTAQPYLLILNDKEEAAYILNDLEQLLGRTMCYSTLEVIEDPTK